MPIAILFFAIVVCVFDGIKLLLRPSASGDRLPPLSLMIDNAKIQNNLQTTKFLHAFFQVSLQLFSTQNLLEVNHHFT
jgi:hypothetical protein